MKKIFSGLCMLLSFYAVAQTAHAYDIVIDEVMADPSPSVALPNYEFIEIRNVSATTINLNGWHIGDETGFASISTNTILKPDSLLVLCANSSASLFSSFGPTLGLSNFPSLNNDGGQLYLRSKEGITIHAIAYTKDWYGNDVKAGGGWTLEMIDTHNPCMGQQNWAASIAPAGGTPGRKNSVDGILTDQQPPSLLMAFAPDSLHALLTFDEPVDSIVALKANYQISDGIGVAINANAQPPLFNQVLLTLSSALQRSKVYTVTVGAITDCSGNAIGAYHTAKLGLAVSILSGDIVINEILFNPKPDGADYVELYNRSESIIDLKDCYLASRSNGNLNTPKQIMTTNRLLFPGEYAVITDNVAAVQRQYLAKNPTAFVSINSMPSLPDDKGDVLLLNAQGLTIDEVQYDEHWQFKLIENPEGVALERINYNSITQDPANWHSAATSAGYGTPGYQNSQFFMDSLADGTIDLQPPIFSPDNDGYNDVLTINYQFPERGYVCNITVFDAQGRTVSHIVRNAICTDHGSFRWDGLSDASAALPIGTYVVLTDIFNLKGKTHRFKKAVTLARRLK